MCDVIKIRLKRRDVMRSGKGNQPLNIKTAVEWHILKNIGLPNFKWSFYFILLHIASLLFMRFLWRHTCHFPVLHFKVQIFYLRKLTCQKNQLNPIVWRSKFFFRLILQITEPNKFFNLKYGLFTLTLKSSDGFRLLGFMLCFL